jgi:hypothetical protein
MMKRPRRARLERFGVYLPVLKAIIIDAIIASRSPRRSSRAGFRSRRRLCSS